MKPYSRKKEIMQMVTDGMQIILSLPLMILNIYKRPRHLLETRAAGELRIVILGTGPSLEKDLESLRGSRNQFHFFAVNNFALSSAFKSIRPNYYCIVDSMYWRPSETLGKSVRMEIEKFYRYINEVKWKLILFVPIEALAHVRKRVINERVDVCGIVMSRYDFDSAFFGTASLSLGLAPPRVNVVLTAIYISILLKYKKINLVGIDMDRIKDLKVDQITNETYMAPTYFDGSNANKAVNFNDKHLGRPPHPVYVRLLREGSTFKWFYFMSQFSEKEGAQIVNSSANSLVDCFQRGHL